MEHIKTYLINLNRRKDRLAEATAQLEKAGVTFERIEAIDGSVLPLPANEHKGSGAYGCRLSHLKVLEDMIDKNYPEALILEDDVVIKDHLTFLNIVRIALQCLPDNWDMLYLGGQHRASPEPFKPNMVKCVDCHRTHSYIVRQSAAPYLYNVWSNNTGHIDHILRETGSFKKLRAYAVDPWMTGQSASRSDINGKAEPERYWDTGCKRCDQQRERREFFKRLRANKENRTRVVR